MKNNKPKKKRKIFRIIFLIILVATAGILIYMALTQGTSSNKKEGKKVVDKIDDFDYTVSETDTKLFKEEFKKLKKVLSEKKVDNKEYANEVAKLFIIDFYTLDNKVTKNDVGGVQFVYSDYKASFIDKARNEFYRYVKSNLDNNRKQDLPIVKSITIDDSEEVSALSVLDPTEFGDKEAYKINVSWEYEKDLGYQEKATLIVVKDNDKFSVAKLTSSGN